MAFKTRLGAQRYNNRMEKIFNEARELQAREDAVRARIAAAVAEERERCARIAETVKTGPIYWVDGWPNAGSVIGGDIIAEAIRNPEDNRKPQYRGAENASARE